MLSSQEGGSCSSWRRRNASSRGHCDHRRDFWIIRPPTGTLIMRARSRGCTPSPRLPAVLTLLAERELVLSFAAKILLLTRFPGSWWPRGSFTEVGAAHRERGSRGGGTAVYYA